MNAGQDTQRGGNVRESLLVVNYLHALEGPVLIAAATVQVAYVPIGDGCEPNQARRHVQLSTSDRSPIPENSTTWRTCTWFCHY